MTPNQQQASNFVKILNFENDQKIPHIHDTVALCDGDPILTLNILPFAEQVAWFIDQKISLWKKAQKMADISISLGGENEQKIGA